MAYLSLALLRAPKRCTLVFEASPAASVVLRAAIGNVVIVSHTSGILRVTASDAVRLIEHSLAGNARKRRCVNGAENEGCKEADRRKRDDAP